MRISLQVVGELAKRFFVCLFVGEARAVCFSVCFSDNYEIEIQLAESVLFHIAPFIDKKEEQESESLQTRRNKQQLYSLVYILTKC